MEDLGDPESGKDEEKAGKRASDHFFAFFLTLLVSSASQHSKATGDKHREKDKAGNGEGVGEQGS